MDEHALGEFVVHLPRELYDCYAATLMNSMIVMHLPQELYDCYAPTSRTL